MAKECPLHLYRLVPALALLVALAGPPVSARAADATTIIQVESPSRDQTSSTRILVNGWAADPSGTGTGVDDVELYLGDPNAGGQSLGPATYGQARPDVARTLGDARFTNSGFQLAVELPAGQHDLYIYAHRNTAAAEDGWAVSSLSFTASTSVRPDAQAAALLGGDQPQVRTAAPPTTTTPSRSSGLTPASVTGPGSGTDVVGPGMRLVGSQSDPIPLEPIVPGMTTVQGTAGNGPELADPTGSGGGIRTSVASDQPGTGQYRTGQVSMTGGGNNTCPGPNCPANSGNVNAQLQNMPSELVRQITGYNIPGLGTNAPCVPSNSSGGCNPQTGTGLAPGAPNGMQQLQSQLQATANAAGQAPQVQSPVNTGPVCNQTTNGQCVNQTGLQGPNGSTCLRFVGSQCAYYGNPPQQQTAATGQLTSTLGQTTGGLNGTSTALGAAGCAQWNGTQCLTPAGAGVGTGTNTNTGSGGFMPGLALTYPAGVVGNGTSSTVGTSATNSLATAASITPGTSSSAIQSTAAAAGVSPYQLSQMGGSQGTAISPSLGTASSTASGVCTQYGPSGNCMSFR